MNKYVDLTYYQRNWDVINIKIIIKMKKNYHKNDTERLREQATDKYRNLSEEEKIKKREYWKNRYHNMSEEEKIRLKKYQRNYRETKKSQYNKNNK